MLDLCHRCFSLLIRHFRLAKIFVNRFGWNSRQRYFKYRRCWEHINSEAGANVTVKIQNLNM